MKVSAVVMENLHHGSVYVVLANHTTQDIEVCIYGHQSAYDEDNPITLLDLFIQ